jgi:hypothetical protein
VSGPFVVRNLAVHAKALVVALRFGEPIRHAAMCFLRE